VAYGFHFGFALVAIAAVNDLAAKVVKTVPSITNNRVGV